MTKRCQSEQKNHPQKNSVHWTCTLDFVVIKSLVCKRVFHLSFEAGSMMRIVLEKKKTCMPLLTLPMSDQERISPYNINTTSSRQVMRIKNNSK